ncbi:hypothetical protein GCM10028857_28110 [Salinarchaeum chitinilyticum]
MQRGLPDAARNVEADPGAVFDAHGADSVDELVASDGSPERDAGSDRAVIRLFEGGLDRPERRSADEIERSGTARVGESTTTPAVLGELERAIEASESDDPATLSAEDLDALDDGDVADALAAAEELEEGELPESVPEAWRGE